MFRQTAENRTGLLVLLCGLFAMTAAFSPVVAGDDTEAAANEQQESRAATLPISVWNSICIRSSPRQSTRTGISHWKSASACTSTVIAPRARRKRRRYLWAEVKLALGQNREAEELFKKAEKDFKKGPYADDAAFLRIVAIESDGRDEDAASEWAKWIKRYGDSPLRPEAMIGICWNEIRRDSVRQASVTLAEIQTNYPYVAQDTRVTLARPDRAALRGFLRAAGPVSRPPSRRGPPRAPASRRTRRSSWPPTPSRRIFIAASCKRSRTHSRPVAAFRAGGAGTCWTPGRRGASRRRSPWPSPPPPCSPRPTGPRPRWARSSIGAVSILEPLTIIVLGVFLAFVVVGFWAPILDVSLGVQS